MAMRHSKLGHGGVLYKIRHSPDDPVTSSSNQLPLSDVTVVQASVYIPHTRSTKSRPITEKPDEKKKKDGMEG